MFSFDVDIGIFNFMENPTLYMLIGESLSEPHTNHINVAFSLYYHHRVYVIPQILCSPTGILQFNFSHCHSAYSIRTYLIQCITAFQQNHTDMRHFL